MKTRILDLLAKMYLISICASALVLFLWWLADIGRLVVLIPIGMVAASAWAMWWLDFGGDRR